MKVLSQRAWRLCSRAAQTRTCTSARSPVWGGWVWRWACPRTCRLGKSFTLSQFPSAQVRCSFSSATRLSAPAPSHHLCRRGCSGASLPLLCSHSSPGFPSLVQRGDSLPPGLHINLCVREKMFEEHLGFVFTKTLVVSHTPRIILPEHCNFLAGHLQWWCRGTKLKEPTMDWSVWMSLWPLSLNRSQTISLLFKNLRETRYLSKRQDSGACARASLVSVQVLCLPAQHLPGQCWLCSRSGSDRGKHFGRLLKPRAARQSLPNHLLWGWVWYSTELHQRRETK